MPGIVLSPELMHIAGPLDDEADVNLVLVHGLEDSWVDVWCASDRSILWPRELLPNEFPAARIFAFSYDVLAAFNAEYSARLLNQLIPYTGGVPIIFIGHSLGGLIIQDALSSGGKSAASSIFDSPVGVIFLGTPFFDQDDDWKQFGKSVAEATNATRPSDSGQLAQLSGVCDKFRKWLETGGRQWISIFCFYESLPVYRMGVLVKENSAVMSESQNAPLQADHFSLSKADGPWDPRYISICEELTRMCPVSKRISGNVSVGRAASPHNREIIIGSVDNNDSCEIQHALALEDQGHFMDAKDAYEKLIDKRNKIQDSDDHVILFCKDKVSCILRSCGQYNAAEKLSKEVLARMKKTTSLGPTHELALHCTGSLIQILRDQGSDEAMMHLLNIPWGKDPYHNITRVRLISILITMLHDFRLALYLARNVLAACEVLLGSDNLYTLDQVSSLALFVSKRGNHRLAEYIDQRGLETLKKTRRSRHPQYLRTTTQLGNHMLSRERYQDAMTLFQGTLKVQESKLDSSHPDVWSTQYSLAIAYAHQGRLGDSKFLLRKVKSQQEKVLKKNHPDTRWTEILLHDLEISSSQSVPQEIQGDKDDENDIKSRQDNEDRLIGTLTESQLHMACFKGDYMRVDELLHSGVDVNAQEGVFGTPLGLASFMGYKAIVEKLLDNGANPNAKGIQAGSALRAALMMNHQDICRLLLAREANPNYIDQWYGSPLHEASMVGNSAMVNLLLNSGAKPNLRGGLFGTALVAAAWNGDVDIVNSLLEKGAFLHGHENGQTALYMATVEEHDDVVQVLKSKAEQDRRKMVAQGHGEVEYPEAAMIEKRNTARTNEHDFPEGITTEFENITSNRPPGVDTRSREHDEFDTTDSGLDEFNATSKGLDDVDTTNTVHDEVTTTSGEPAEANTTSNGHDELNTTGNRHVAFDSDNTITTQRHNEAAQRATWNAGQKPFETKGRNSSEVALRSPESTTAGEKRGGVMGRLTRKASRQLFSPVKKRSGDLKQQMKSMFNKMEPFKNMRNQHENSVGVAA